eukprot:4807949-Amphidinium_carterae.3
MLYSGGVIMLMGAYVCGWTRKQACVAGLSEGTYVRNLLCELLKFDAEDKASIPLHVHERAGVTPKSSILAYALCIAKTCLRKDRHTCANSLV